MMQRGPLDVGGVLIEVFAQAVEFSEQRLSFDFLVGHEEGYAAAIGGLRAGAAEHSRGRVDRTLAEDDRWSGRPVGFEAQDQAADEAQ